MQEEKLIVPKFTIIITTKCNLKCKLCCEYVPQNKPFDDITVLECRNILRQFFKVVDHVQTLHLSGGGEPFLHRQLGSLIEECMVYTDQFDRLMLFTNSTVVPTDDLLNVLHKYKERLVVQVSHYGIMRDREHVVLELLQHTGVTIKFQKYYGDDQTFGGWVDFGEWKDHQRSRNELETVYRNCGITSNMKGNWRTRDGKIHWCSRSQRGNELGLIPDFPDDYIDLFDETPIKEKRKRFRTFLERPYIDACRFCNGDVGTQDREKRYRAAEQMQGENNDV